MTQSPAQPSSESKHRPHRQISPTGRSLLHFSISLRAFGRLSASAPMRGDEERFLWKRLHRLILRIAELLQVALGAFRFARGANATPMPDQLVGKLDPLFPRDYLHQVLLDLLGVFVPRQIQPVRQTLDMRIHNNPAGDPERRAEDHVRRLSRYARQRQYLLHRARHLPAELFQNRLARSHYGLRLVPEKPRWPDLQFQFSWVRMGERFRARILLVESCRHLIPAHVRALRGEDRGS